MSEDRNKEVAGFVWDKEEIKKLREELALEKVRVAQLEEALTRIREEDTQVVLGDAGKNKLTIGKLGVIARTALSSSNSNTLEAVREAIVALETNEVLEIDEAGNVTAVGSRKDSAQAAAKLRTAFGLTGEGGER